MNKFLVTALAVLCAAPATAAKDNFNRIYLGNDWVVPYPTLSISNDRLVGTSLALGYDQKSSNDSKAKVTVYLNGTDVEYGAVALGDISSGNNAFVKIQETNGDGVFEYGAFYTGNDDGIGDYFPLNSTVSSPAVLTVSLCGTKAIMTIKSSSGTQKYSYDYGTSFSTGAGLGTYGNVSLDNYRSSTATCKDAIGAMVISHSTGRDPSLSR
jgi:hypothetical protein